MSKSGSGSDEEAGDDPGNLAPTVAEPGSAPRRGAAAPRGPDKTPRNQRIGPYRILELLGEGGMGAVYLAEQTEPVERRVALKLIHASLRSPTALARFTAERQAMARFSHPNVAQLYEAGTTEDGFPWFAMEHVPGQPLTDYCDEHRLRIEERLQLFVDVCTGVQHAHQKGILHRDLKPSNVLVAELEGRPVPKVIDFGIAKAVDQPLTDEPELTVTGTVGTPAYMSPEALAGSGDVDTRSDVFSLGVILYELLAGVRPHQLAGGALKARHRVDFSRGETHRPSTRISGLDETLSGTVATRRRLSARALASRVDGDLDWIAMKSIAVEPERRYASAAELAADLGRHLSDLPVEARPPSARYRMGKFVRRYRVAVAAAMVVAVALILGMVGTTLGLLRAQQEAKRADREAAAALQVATFLTELFKVSDPGEARGNEVTARELLDRGAKRIATELQEQPLLRGRMMRTMGEVYTHLGLYEDAIALEQEALGLREEQLGKDDPEVARSLNALGDLYSLEGRYAEALPLHRRALAIQERAMGTDNADIANSLNSLGRASYLLGDSEWAESHYRRALAIREAAFGPDHLDVAESLAHLGWMFTNEERFEEAEEVLLRALGIRETELGTDHFLVTETLDALSDLYELAGRLEEAEDARLRGLAVKQKVFEPDHPDIAASLFVLGRIYHAQGRHDEAEASLRRGLEIGRTGLGPDHVDLTRGYQALGMLAAEQGRWEEAEASFRRMVEIFEQALGPTHEWVGQALNNQGWALSDGLQRYAEGEAVLRQAVAIFPAGPEENGIWSAVTRWSLANNLRDQKRHAEAEALYEKTLEIMIDTGGSRRRDNPQLPELVADYTKMLRETGRDAEVRALEERYIHGNVDRARSEE